MVVANKACRDARECPRRVSTEAGRAWAMKRNLPFLEASAKQGIHVEEAFDALLWHIKVRFHEYRVWLAPKGDPNELRVGRDEFLC